MCIRSRKQSNPARNVRRKSIATGPTPIESPHHQPRRRVETVCARVHCTFIPRRLSRTPRAQLTCLIVPESCPLLPRCLQWVTPAMGSIATWYVFKRARCCIDAPMLIHACFRSSPMCISCRPRDMPRRRVSRFPRSPAGLCRRPKSPVTRPPSTGPTSTDPTMGASS